MARWEAAKGVAMSSLLLWTCVSPGCAVSVINDAQGQTAHQATTGHVPVLGQPMAWVFDRDAAAA
jgi:hypothetical protein